MSYPKPEYPVPPMTVEAASDYAQKIHAFLEAGNRSDDDLDTAYEAFERQFSVSKWTIEHLRKRNAKSCDVSVYAKIKGAYLALMERQVKKFQHQIAIEKATTNDADLLILEAEAAALAAKIAARKALINPSKEK